VSKHHLVRVNANLPKAVTSNSLPTKKTHSLQIPNYSISFILI